MKGNPGRGGIVAFTDDACLAKRTVGGKGANLGCLVKAGFNVPAGFVIPTDAYLNFVECASIADAIRAEEASIDYRDADNLEQSTARIRALIEGAPLPDGLRDEVLSAYARLGECPYVAVRSSGAAEDLAEASFAGLHDTYLDIRGADTLLDAIKRCWASLWSARATSYRRSNGYDHFASPIAVVVQIMIDSEVAGVMFTANPLNDATDEIIINSSWGLGEAIVAGIATPDEFIAKQRGLRLVAKTLGSKALHIRRDQAKGQGTITEDVPQAERERYSLSDAQVVDLARLGLRIQESYEGFPLDIEWALNDGRFYVLQARPVTGGRFSWDADVNLSVQGEEDYDTTWSRTWADAVWTGAITPLMFSWRARITIHSLQHVLDTMGCTDVSLTAKNFFHFHKATVYANADVDRAMTVETMPPEFRAAVVERLPLTWREETIKAPFDYLKYLQMILRYQTQIPGEAFGWAPRMYKIKETRAQEYHGLSQEKLRALSDGELKQYVGHMIDLEQEFYDAPMFGLVFLFRDSAMLLSLMVRHWYTGTNPNVAMDIFAGTRRRSITAIENVGLWQLAQRIRQSTALTDLFYHHRDGDFFAALEHGEEGCAFLVEYREYLRKHGHRGHEDRDIYFPRRADDPSLDYTAIGALLSVKESVNPEVLEEKVNARREDAVREVIENFRSQAFADFKVQAFEAVLGFTLTNITGRDDQRDFCDVSTYAIRKGFIEVGRRLLERGLIETERDFYFLSEDELYELFEGRVNMRLAKAKIAARMRDFDEVNRREIQHARYLVRGREVELDRVDADAEGALRGAPVSRGKVTGTARVIKSLKEIGRVREGEILIVNSTDPGWTPVFLIIRGIVLETGGVMAHGALLAREYGFPAVQLEGALKLIPDGATITVDGDMGFIAIHESSGDPDAETAEPRRRAA